jgi:O-glycosyl hydrolase
MKYSGCSILGLCCLLVSVVHGQTVSADFTDSARRQKMDGFGTFIGDDGRSDQGWYEDLIEQDLHSSIIRVQMTPRFKSPWSDHTYNSPWFHGQPALPGPDGNNVRTYFDAKSYTREWAGHQAQIAVMGPDAEDNYKRYYDYQNARVLGSGKLAARVIEHGKNEGGVKLYGTVWSPPPWVKVSSGNRLGGMNDPMPKNNPAFPFIWFDNFSGGMIDASGTPRAEFDDSALPGGRGPTSAITQLARGLTAWSLGYQRAFGVKFYAISIQNELHLEVFYDSCLYRTADQYVTALKTVRAEFDKYPELRDVKIIGPEDTVGAESTYLWYWNNNGFKQSKLLQFMQAIEADPVASKALAFYCVHGYAADGITSAGAEPAVWNWAAHGWQAAPNPTVPPDVKGYESFGKGCWMTETSGENPAWRYPLPGFPSSGAFSIALKIHQAVTVGDVSGWLYWALAAGEKADYPESLTTSKVLGTSAKLAALRHYSRFIRPGAVRFDTAVDGSHTIKSSVFKNTDGSIVFVLLNAGDQEQPNTIKISGAISTSGPAARLEAVSFTSDSAAIWQKSKISFTDGKATMKLPACSATTVVIRPGSSR